MSSSRAVFLSLVMILTLYLLFIKKKIGTISILWLFVFLFFWSMYQLQDSANPRLNELANSVEALSLYISGEINIGGSLEWRRELIENGLNAFKSTHGLGLGAGGSLANQEMIGAVDGRFTSMHNFWIELLVEGGVFVALLLLFWITNLIFKLFLISKTNSRKIKYYSESSLLSLIAFIPAAISASSTIYFFPMWIFFGFVISIISVF